MTEELHKKKCIPCEKGGKALEQEKITELLLKIKAWIPLREGSAGHVLKIQKTITFTDFKSALGFINEVGDLAEFEGHHPDMNLHSWNKVTITLSTHAVKGLTENDFIIASKIDKILEESA